ncbi:MAG TPA: hypothetical protein VF149_00710 [Bacillales bacterium]
MVKRAIISSALGLSLVVCGAFSLFHAQNSVNNDTSKNLLAEHGRIPTSPALLLAEHGRIPTSPELLLAEHGRIPTVKEPILFEHGRIPT